MSTRSNTQTLKPTVSSASLDTLEDIEETKRLDARLARLHRDILPRAPYLLTVPTDRPYHISPSQADNWRRGTLFDADEEALQYMSYIPRDPSDGLIVTVGDWDDGNGGIMKKETTKENGPTTPQRPPVQKKKITLSAYKRKTQAAEGGKTVPKPPVVDEVKKEETKVNGVSSAAEKPVVSSLPPDKDKKR